MLTLVRPSLSDIELVPQAENYMVLMPVLKHCGTALQIPKLWYRLNSVPMLEKRAIISVPLLLLLL